MRYRSFATYFFLQFISYPITLNHHYTNSGKLELIVKIIPHLKISDAYLYACICLNELCSDSSISKKIVSFCNSRLGYQSELSA